MLGERGYGGGSGRYAWYPAPYLLALDFCHARWRFSSVLSEVRHRFGLKPEIESPVLPHITLLDPFDLPPGGTVQDILNIAGRVARKQSFLPYRIDGWERREGVHGWIIAHRVEPSEALVRFQEVLAEDLVGKVKKDDAWNCGSDEFWHHSTVVLNVPEERCRKIWDGLSEMPTLSVHLPLSSFRVLVLRFGRVVREYDLALRRSFSPNEGHLVSVKQQSLRWFRRTAGLECTTANVASSPASFVLADTHFGHANIIRYCSRPFVSRKGEEMDQVLLRNWNRTVGPQDRVYFLGDLCYGPQSRSPEYYRKRLQGAITFIRGNHDGGMEIAIDHQVLEYKGIRFLLVHDPGPWNGKFDGWILHGHHHNNHLTGYPFFDPHKRTVNVSVEVTGYRPVGMDEIVSLIRKERSVRWTRSSLTSPQSL
jgi:calcineurin-like phosphoesterase family protein/2'-5' RNA ligase